jgi:hypothetical protein
MTQEAHNPLAQRLAQRRLDRDPLRDPALGELLRLGAVPVPETRLDWKSVASKTAAGALSVRLRDSADWWEITAGWRRPALAASIAAAILAGGLFARLLAENASTAGLERAPLERIAIVQVAGGYTDEDAFTSLLRKAGDTLVWRTE